MSQPKHTEEFYNTYISTHFDDYPCNITKNPRYFVRLEINF